VRFQVLGDVRGDHQGVPVGIGRRQERCLLGILLTEAGRPVSADRLADLLWDGHPSARARGVIQTYIGRLRAALLPYGVSIATRAGGYVLDVAPEQVDVHRFRAAVESVRRCDDPVRTAAVLTEALALWRGPLLGDVATERLRSRLGAGLEELRLTAVEECAKAELEAGCPDRTIAMLAGPATEFPVRERAVALLMHAYAATGRTAEALAVYRRVRQLMVDELGLEPGAELQHVHEAVLHGDEPLTAPAAGGQPLSPSRVFRPLQLPPDLADFVGRQDAIRAILEGLPGKPAGSFPAVAAISGMPGVGKSALAIHVAHMLREEYPDGQVYLDLAGDDIGRIDTHGALGQVLAGLGFSATALPVTSAERTAVLRSLCAERQLLLVLDNAASAEHIRPLLPAGRRCGVLVTSRAHLGGLSAAPHVELAPLARDEAVHLLRSIAGAGRTDADPGAALQVAEACAGLPLAIRIAGTRLAVRPHRSVRWLAQRLAADTTRLDELSIAGSAVRSSIDVSYADLDGTLQRSLRALALLDVPEMGIWLVAAALGSSVAEAEEAVDGLLQAHLLTVAPAGAGGLSRFRFHQLIRLYARELAVDIDPPGDRAAVMSRAYGACITVATALGSRLRRHPKLIDAGAGWPAVADGDGPGADPTSLLTAERGTLVAAVHALIAIGQPRAAADLALTLQRFLETHHHFTDWQDIATAALAAIRLAGDREAEAALLWSLGELATVQDRYSAAEQLFQQVLGGPGSEGVQARALIGLSMVHLANGQLDDAAARVTAALGLLAGSADEGVIAEAWMALGRIQHHLADPSGADLSFGRALAGFASTGDRLNQAILLVNIGTAKSAAGHWQEAEEALVQSAAICQEIGFRNGEGFAYTALGSLLRRTGEKARAEETLVRALAIVREYADQFTEGFILNNLGELFRETDPARSRRYFREAIGRLQDSDLITLMADALIGLGDTEKSTGGDDAAHAAWRRALTVIDKSDASRASMVKQRLEPGPGAGPGDGPGPAS
jgi:DNA-binding SARP family transcriptional activator/tetratricopeptide (TPR) repeat protein